MLPLYRCNSPFFERRTWGRICDNFSLKNVPSDIKLCLQLTLRFAKMVFIIHFVSMIYVAVKFGRAPLVLLAFKLLYLIPFVLFAKGQYLFMRISMSILVFFLANILSNIHGPKSNLHSLHIVLSFYSMFMYTAKEHLLGISYLPYRICFVVLNIIGLLQVQFAVIPFLEAYLDDNPFCMSSIPVHSRCCFSLNVSKTGSSS